MKALHFYRFFSIFLHRFISPFSRIQDIICCQTAISPVIFLFFFLFSLELYIQHLSAIQLYLLNTTASFLQFNPLFIVNKISRITFFQVFLNYKGKKKKDSVPYF